MADQQSSVKFSSIRGMEALETLHKMGTVAPNRKLVVSPRKLHFVEAGTAHAGGKLG